MEVGSSRPEGTIALLFTDIEGSTRLAARLGAAWPGVLADHHALVGQAVAEEGGFVAGTEGDSFFCTFSAAASAARAAVAALRRLRAHEWPQEVGELGVRMGLHVGYVERRPTGYVGLEVHRAARVAAAAHGGQLLLTGPARGLVGDVVRTEPLGSHRLKDFPVPEALFCAVVDGRGAKSFPPPRTQEFRPTNLPAGAPVLVGRDGDLARVRRALTNDGERLVTLTGRGGVGKTSLALVAASDLLDQHPGGVWLVKLATVSAAAEVLPAVASATGADGHPSGSPFEVVVARLRGRGPVLLVLDNLEHVMAAAPELIALLDAVRELRLLVTSQVPLRVEAERCMPLDALDDGAALALIERVAQRRGIGFSVSKADRAALLEVAHVLDGLPLALELAAARLALLSPAQLRERLQKTPDLLQDAGGDRPDRQRSLLATVQWTLSLVAGAPQELFARMGVFAGAVELEEVEAVVGADGLDVLEALATLLDVALVRRVETGDGRVRLGLPEALRRIAADMLDAAPDAQRWRRAHAQRQHEVTWVVRNTWVSGAAYRAAIAADAEADAALRWARATADPLAAPLAAARASILTGGGRVREAMEVLTPLLQQPSGDPMVDSSALVANAWALAVVGRMDESIASAERAIALTADAKTRARALVVRALGLAFRRELDAALRDSEQATALARGLGPGPRCGALVAEARVLVLAGDNDLAGQRLDEAESAGASLDITGLGQLEPSRGALAMRSGRPEQALEHYARAMEQGQDRQVGLQVLAGVGGVVNALVLLEEDAEAVEVAGLAEALAADVAGPGSGPRIGHMIGRDALAASEQRLGSEIAAELKARGRAVPPGYRITRACQLARECATSRVTSITVG